MKYAIFTPLLILHIRVECVCVCVFTHINNTRNRPLLLLVPRNNACHSLLENISFLLQQR
jgi:hypothetical protein